MLRIHRTSRNRSALFLIALSIFTAPAALTQQIHAGAEQHSAVPAAPMSKDAHPSFDVATIKASDPNAVNGNFIIGGHRISIQNQTIASLISFAFSMHPKQIVDGPAWLDNQGYDIVGQSEIEGVPDLQQTQEMLQKLLVTRFGLRFHTQKRELSIYAITVAKGGPKLTKSTASPDELPTQSGGRNGKEQTRRFTNNSMSDLALGMSNFLDRPVVNETGLTGRYDFILKWTPDNAPLTEQSAAPGLFTAFQEQLGLKLEPKRGPADVLVIDRCEKPSEN